MSAEEIVVNPSILDPPLGPYIGTCAAEPTYRSEDPEEISASQDG